MTDRTEKEQGSVQDQNNRTEVGQHNRKQEKESKPAEGTIQTGNVDAGLGSNQNGDSRNDIRGGGSQLSGH